MSNPFSFVIVPDTQRLTEKHPEKLSRLVRWIADHAQEYRVQAVLHVGDVVHNKDDGEFERAKAAWQTIDEAQIPLFMAMGNHDYDNHLTKDRGSDSFNRYFGIQRYLGKPWFGGAFQEDRAENVYGTLEADGCKFLILVLEFGPRDEVLSWADTVVESHPDHRVIVLTHCYMYLDGNRTRPGANHHPRDYRGTADANDGEDLWNRFIRKHANITAVYSGHHVFDPISYRVDYGDHGNLVFQSFQNWQESEGGGEGRIRLVHYDPAAKEVRCRVFNPALGAFETEEGWEVTYPLQESADSAGEERVQLRFPADR